MKQIETVYGESQGLYLYTTLMAQGIQEESPKGAVLLSGKRGQNMFNNLNTVSFASNLDQIGQNFER